MYDYAQAAASEVSDEGELMESINPAFIQRIGDEDSVEKIDPVRPGSNYAPFLEGSLRMISAASNIPYEIVAKNFHRTSFASGKLALNDGDMGFSMRRSVVQDTALSPIHTRCIWDRVLYD
jgi:capsid protein